MHTNTPMGSSPNPTPDGHTNPTGPAKAPRRRRLGAIAGAGLLAGLIAAAIGGVAGAQTAGTTVLTEVDRSVAAVQVAEVDEGDDVLFEISPEDEAVWEQFDQCLVDAGVDFDALDAAFEAGDESTLDFDALDAAFDSCDPILENLSDDFAHFDAATLDGEAFEISPEDEAVWEQYDQCLVDNGLDFEAMEAEVIPAEELDASEGDVMVEAIELDSSFEAAFEACDPILENLSEDMSQMFEISPEDEAVWEQFDQCLVDAGVDFDALDAAFEAGDESTVDFDALDAAFDSCDPILENLSDDMLVVEFDEE